MNTLCCIRTMARPSGMKGRTRAPQHGVSPRHHGGRRRPVPRADRVVDAALSERPQDTVTAGGLGQEVPPEWGRSLNPIPKMWILSDVSSSQI